jgi:hypothetical protein
MYFFSHIPKTAGTSLGFILEYMFDRQTFWDYRETYAYDECLCNHLRSLSEKNYIRLIGGHISAKQYEPLISSMETIFLYTARDPYSHFISKLNHDFNNAIDKAGQSMIESVAHLSSFNRAKNTWDVPLSKVADIISIDSIFSQPSMQNYLKAYIEIGDAIPGTRVYPFLTDSIDLSLQYFVWNESRNGVSLQRRDPAALAIIPARNEAMSSKAERPPMPILNSGDSRKYSLILSDCDVERIGDFLSCSIEYYHGIRCLHKESIAAAEADGFKYYNSNLCAFALASKKSTMSS